jgi:hypothetical protein
MLEGVGPVSIAWNVNVPDVSVACRAIDSGTAFLTLPLANVLALRLVAACNYVPFKLPSGVYDSTTELVDDPVIVLGADSTGDFANVQGVGSLAGSIDHKDGLALINIEVDLIDLPTSP